MATTATKTDTPLRDIPQSIQAIPRQLIEDRQIELKAFAIIRSLLRKASLDIGSGKVENSMNIL